MNVVDYMDFRNKVAEHLNSVTEDRDILVVSCPNGKNVVVMDLQEYNAIKETLHLTSTAANHKRLSEAIDEMNTGRGKKNQLITK